MINRLKYHKRLNETIFMLGISLFAFGLSAFRVFYTGTYYFVFLNWNLFLAFIPWAVTSWISIHPEWQKKPLLVIILLASWLLFFPNAPYILTDLFHLRLRTRMPVWYDMSMIMAFAWAGLMFGLLSLRDIEIILKKKIKPVIVKFISVFLIFLGSFGVYIGRYLRYNSWDIFRQPETIISDIGKRVIYPMDYLDTWGMTIVLGLFLSLVYFSFDIIRRRKEDITLSDR